MADIFLAEMVVADMVCGRYRRPPMTLLLLTHTDCSDTIMKTLHGISHIQSGKHQQCWCVDRKMTIQRAKMIGTSIHHAMPTLVHALVVSKVYYSCSVMTTVSGHLMSVLNAAARLLFSARHSKHITPFFPTLM